MARHQQHWKMPSMGLSVSRLDTERISQLEDTLLETSLNETQRKNKEIRTRYLTQG